MLESEGIENNQNETSNSDSVSSGLFQINLNNVNQKGKHCEIKIIQSIKETSKEPIRFEVRAPVKWFIGREEKLKEIHSAFEESSTEGMIIRTVAIVGMGGMGKTELTKKYAKEYGQNYRHLIWINAEKQEDLKYSFSKLYDLLPKDVRHENSSILEFHVTYLYKCIGSETALLMFDNVENIDDIIDFLPKDSPHNICTIINSRCQNWVIGGMGKIFIVELSKFSNDEAIKYLNGRLMESKKLGDICRLIEKFDAFPLGLNHAVGYINMENDTRININEELFTIENYLSHYENKTKVLFETKPVDAYKRTIYTTWNITIEKIRKNEKHGKHAENILHIIAYFNPLINFDQFSEAYSKVFNEITKIDSKCALRYIQNYSMITLDKDNISVHRTLQYVIRATLKFNNEEEKILENALRMLPNLDDSHVSQIWGVGVEYKNLIKKYGNTQYYFRDSFLHYFAISHNEALKKIEVSEHIDVNLRDVFNCTAIEYALKTQYLDGVLCLWKNGAVLENISDNFPRDEIITIHDEILFELCSRTEKLNNLNNRCYVINKSVTDPFSEFELDHEESTISFNLLPNSSHYDIDNQFDRLLLFKIKNKTTCTKKKDAEEELNLFHFNIAEYYLKGIVKYFTFVVEETKFNVNTKNGVGNTLLHEASEIGHDLDILKYLIDKGADINAENSFGMTPAFYAVLFNKDDKLKYFLDQESLKTTCSLNSIFGKLGITLQKWAILCRNDSAIEILKTRKQDDANSSKSNFYRETRNIFNEMMNTLTTSEELKKIINVRSLNVIFNLLTNNFTYDKIAHELKENFNVSKLIEGDFIDSRGIGVTEKIFKFIKKHECIQTLFKEQRFINDLHQDKMQFYFKYKLKHKKLDIISKHFKIPISIGLGDLKENCLYIGFQPTDPVQNYVCGKDMLEKIHQCLQNGQNVVVVEPVEIGKIEFARKYVQLYKDSYDDIFWIDATTRYLVIVFFDELLRQNKTLEKRTPLIRKIKHAHRILNSRGNVLYVFNNAESLDTLKDFLPTSGSRVLINTRNLYDWERSESWKLEVLEMKEYSTKETEYCVEKECQSAEQTKRSMNILGFESSTLKQAVEYVKKECEMDRKLDIEDYRKIYTERINCKGGIYETIETITWKIIFTKIENTLDYPGDLNYSKIIAFLEQEIDFVLQNAPEQQREIIDSNEKYLLVKMFDVINQDLSKVCQDENFVLHLITFLFKANRQLALYLTLTTNVLIRILNSFDFRFEIIIGFLRSFKYEKKKVDLCIDEDFVTTYIIQTLVINRKPVHLKKFLEMLFLKCGFFCFEIFHKYFSLCLEHGFMEGIELFEEQCLVNDYNNRDLYEYCLNYKISPFHVAAANGWEEIVIYLKGNFKLLVNIEYENGIKPAILAAYFGHVEVVNILSENKQLRLIARLNDAVEDNDKERFKSILDEFKRENPSTNLDSIFDVTLVNDVTIEDDDSILTFEIADSKNCAIFEGSYTKLHNASFNGDLLKIKSLLRNIHRLKNLIDERDYNENSVLHLAALNGHLDVVQFLINDQNIGPNAVNIMGSTPLHLAALFGRFNVVKWLIEEGGADVNAKDKIGATPEFYAAFGDNGDLVKFLLDQVQSNSKSDVVPQLPEKPILLLQNLGIGLHDIFPVLNNLEIAKTHYKCKANYFVRCCVKIFGRENFFKYVIPKCFIPDRKFSSSDVDDFLNDLKLDPDYKSQFVEWKLYLLFICGLLKKRNKGDEYLKSLCAIENFIKHINSSDNIDFDSDPNFISYFLNFESDYE